MYPNEPTVPSGVPFGGLFGGGTQYVPPPRAGFGAMLQNRAAGTGSAPLPPRYQGYESLDPGGGPAWLQGPPNAQGQPTWHRAGVPAYPAPWPAPLPPQGFKQQQSAGYGPRNASQSSFPFDYRLTPEQMAQIAQMAFRESEWESAAREMRRLASFARSNPAVWRYR